MKPASNHTRMLPVLMILSMLLSGFISGRLSSVDSAGEGGASFAGVYLCQAQENSLLVFTGHFTLGADGTLQDDVLKLTGTWQETSPGQLHFTIAADVESAYSSDDGKGLIIQLAPGSTRPHVRDGKLHCYKTKAGEAEPAPALAPDVVLPNDPITLPLPVNKILFSSNQNTNDDIFVMNADGKDVTELTHDIANDRDPAWSVDGKKILFSSNRDGDYEIFQMNAQGTELVQITQNKFDDFSPSLSLNGKQIAFVSIRSGDSPQLYVMNADGTGEVKLTDFAGGIGSPSWSPNSQQIAFHTLQPRNMEIYVLDLESRSLTRLTDNANNNWGPAWQPNGGWIAYASGHFGSGDTEIYRVETDTEAPVPVRITYNNTDDWSPSWSADATQVVFISNRNGEPDIYRMDASGENQVQLTDTSASEAAPEMTAQNMTIQKVLHLVWNPYLPQRRAKLIDYLNYLNPATTAEKAVTSFQLYNDNRFRFLIEEQIEINAFPVHSNGFVFTEETYFECMEQGWPDTEICSGNIITDYDLIINDPELDICGRVNRGEIDEVWLDPPPYTGFAETAW